MGREKFPYVVFISRTPLTSHPAYEVRAMLREEAKKRKAARLGHFVECRGYLKLMGLSPAKAGLPPKGKKARRWDRDTLLEWAQSKTGVGEEWDLFSDLFAGEE